MIKVALIVMVGVFVGVLLRGMKAEYALVVSIALSLFVALSVFRAAEELLQKIGEFKNWMGSSFFYLGILVKVMGIAYLSEFASGICKDGGMNGPAKQIEIFGKVAILISGLPIVLSVLDLIQEFTV